MSSATAAKRTINIELSEPLYDKLKELASQKSIPSMRSFCTEAINEKIIQLERAKKYKIMEEALKDPGFQQRCAEVQDDYAAIDYTGGNEEW